MNPRLGNPTAGGERWTRPHGATQSRPHPHLGHEHIGAVFANRETAEDAVVALRARGLGSDHLGVAVHDDRAIAFECDATAPMIRDTEVGVATGAPIGALAGIGLAALTMTGVGAVIGVGGLIALAGASGLMGGVIGGYLGVAAGFDDWDEHQLFGYHPLEPGEVLVVVCGDGGADGASAMLVRSGGRMIADRTDT